MNAHIFDSYHIQAQIRSITPFNSLLAQDHGPDYFFDNIPSKTVSSEMIVTFGLRVYVRKTFR